MKRWLALFVVLMLAGVAAWFIAWYMTLESRFSRVQVGMSKAEVEHIMGLGETYHHGLYSGVSREELLWEDNYSPHRYFVDFEDDRAVRKLIGVRR